MIFDRTAFGIKLGTSITRKGVDPMYGRELMGIKSDRVYGRTCSRGLKQAAAKAYLQAIKEDDA